MKYLTFDLECENHRLNKRLASPFDERNYIVELGWSINGGQPQKTYYKEWHRDAVMPCLDDIDVLVLFNAKFDLLWVWREPTVTKFLKEGGRIYCGQYAEYLLGGMTQDVHMCSMNNIAESYGGGCKIDAVKEMWEEGYLTSEIPEDLLTDYLIGDGKDIVGDVHNTWLIFIGQMKRIAEEMSPEFKTMLNFRMDGLLATTEMEYNGMFIDEGRGEVLRKQLVIDLDDAVEELEKFIPELPPELEFNWGSPLHKSCLIFGGTAKYEKWVQYEDTEGHLGLQWIKKKQPQPYFTLGKQVSVVPPEKCILAGELYIIPVPEGTPGAVKNNDKFYLIQDRFKSGKRKGEGKSKQVSVDDLDKPKGRKVDHYFTFKGYTAPKAKWKGENTDAYDGPLYSTAADVIEELGTRNLEFTNALIIRTRIAKDLGTYYWTENAKGVRTGMLTLVDDKGIIHHKLNHTSTVTSRMSSSDPNMQNIPRSDEDDQGEAKSKVKQMFTSRFGVVGRMAEIDYSQLEVVIQGVLSGDKQLCRDLNNKIDFHCKRLATTLGESYEHVWKMCHEPKDTEYKKKRTKAKRFSFRRAYGAGAATIADGEKIPLDDVKALIVAEEKMYPTVVQFDKLLEKEIVANRIQANKRIFVQGIAFKQGESHWDSPTGTRYVWSEHETPEFMHKHGKYTGFSPTERKNYPVQGFGGEIMQTMLGIVFRYFLENDRFNDEVLLVNTVHDCCLLDGKKDKLLTVTKEVQKLLETVPEVFNKAYNNTLNITVPFPAEAEVGRDLFKMDVVH